MNEDQKTNFSLKIIEIVNNWQRVWIYLTIFIVFLRHWLVGLRVFECCYKMLSSSSPVISQLGVWLQGRSNQGIIILSRITNSTNETLRTQTKIFSLK